MKFPKLLLSLVAVFAPVAAFAQSSWPDKPIRIIVPFTAGSGTDIIARTLAEPMTMAPAAFDAFLKAETARMAQVVKSAGIKVQ